MSEQTPGLSGGFKEYREHNNGITWKDYVDLRFAEADKALSYAKLDMDRRLDGMNELRQQLDRQAGTFVSRDNFDLAMQRILERIVTAEKAMAGSEGSRRVYIVLIAAIVSIVVGVVVAMIGRGL